ncbi:hypothetical protein D3C87_1579930 [compost metagenome]
MLTDSSLKAATGRSTGSLTTCAPGATVTPGWPPKLKARLEGPRIAAPSPASATWAAPITSGCAP